MATAGKVTKSITIDPDLSDYVSSTKREHQSDSARISELIRRAMLQEINESLESEAEAFYQEANKHRTGTLAFQEAALRTFERD
jgi:hypothetical protein